MLIYSHLTKSYSIWFYNTKITFDKIIVPTSKRMDFIEMEDIKFYYCDSI